MLKTIFLKISALYTVQLEKRNKKKQFDVDQNIVENSTFSL